MKVFLILSLIANGILGYLLMMKEKPPVMERLIIETHGEPRKVEIKETRAHLPVAPIPEKKSSEKSQGDSTRPFYMTPDEQLVQEAGDKMERDRIDFLTNELRIPEAILEQQERLRLEYNLEQARVWKDHPSGDLPVKTRRELLDKEEAYYQKLEDLFGKKNWERYKEFREKHNSRGAKLGPDSNEPFIFMGF